jgi:pimeloyl-ACP methyl ester carboxylesterase
MALFFPRAVVAQDAPLAPYDSVLVNGISLAFRDVGEGPPLVLLHGFTGTSAVWDPFLAEFSSHHRVVVPDLRGHGRSFNPSGSFTHRELAEDVFALLDHLGIGRFSAIGSSMGAMTLLHAATLDPERVESMILAGGAPYLPESARAIYRRIDPDTIPPERLAVMVDQHSRGVEQAMQLQRQFAAYRDSYDDMTFTPPHLATIGANTLIIHGDRDEFFPVSLAFEMYEAIPSSYLWVVPNGGHGVLGTDHGNQLFTQTALDFLSGRWEER